MQRLSLLITLVGLSHTAASIARADIYQWEYTDPADPSQGKRQSATLAPGGAGVDATPGANLSARSLTMAYLIRADLADATFGYSTLTSADFTEANLSNVDFLGGTLTNAAFRAADIRGGRFGVVYHYDEAFQLEAIGTQLTLEQLYSTASYQAKDLSRIKFDRHDLSGVNFAGSDLTQVSFAGARLADADFTGALIRAANFSRISAYPYYPFPVGTGLTVAQLYSTVEYQIKDLSSIGFSGNDFAGADFSGQNLANTNLSAVLANANFAGSDVRGTSFYSTTSSGFTAEQLYSTDSYQTKDLRGIDLGRNDLSGWDFSGQELADADFTRSHATGATIRQANLSNVDFSGTDLTGADLADANIRGASFLKGYRDDFSVGTRGGITLEQLYSTVSYRAHELGAVNLGGNLLVGGAFIGQILVNANFSSGELTTLLSGANFSGADARGVTFASAVLDGTNFSTANLADTNFAYAKLTNANFDQANLANAIFDGTILTNADFTGAEVRGASFYKYPWQEAGIEITAAQLYSTSSYKAKDLSGITLFGTGLSGANFGGQNLTNADISGTTLTGADFTAADTRGAFIFNQIILSEIISGNLIQQNGHISGLDLLDGRQHVVRDYDGDSRYDDDPIRPPIPITVDQHLAMGPGGTLRMVFEADAWDSTISFAPVSRSRSAARWSSPFRDDVNLASQVGRTLHVFFWTGVNPTGVFTVSSPYQWDTSRLYTTGEVTLAAVPEPSALLFVGVGLIALATTRKMAFTPRAVAMKALTTSMSADLSSQPTQIQSLELNCLNSCQGDYREVPHHNS